MKADWERIAARERRRIPRQWRNLSSDTRLDKGTDPAVNTDIKEIESRLAVDHTVIDKAIDAGESGVMCEGCGWLILPHQRARSERKVPIQQLDHMVHVLDVTRRDVADLLAEVKRLRSHSDTLADVSGVLIDAIKTGRTDIRFAVEQAQRYLNQYKEVTK